jgi:DNA-binding LacI/PurR family transcriptional regulator
VAHAAGVSQSVVSRAFSQDPSVATATRQKIFSIASKLGYRPNLIARSMITKRSHTLALVTGGLTNPLFLNVIDAVTRATQDLGYRVLLQATSPGQSLDDAIGEVLQHQPDGILALAGTPSVDMVGECRRVGIPILLLGRSGNPSMASSVSCDNFAAARLIGDSLVEAGHRRLAFVASRAHNLSFSRERERGFTAAVNDAFGAPPLVRNGDSNYAGGYAAGMQLMALDPRPDAVFCAGDSMALGLMDAARYEFGLRIPEDLSVIGFDDVPMASWASYMLSTFRQPVDLMARTATEVLVKQSRSEATPVSLLIPGDLVVRRSARLPERLS